MNYKVSAKRNGKWWTFGNIKINQYGNPQLSFKNTPELKELVNSDAQWLNFSMFEDKPKDEPKQEAPAPYVDGGEIPF